MEGFVGTKNTKIVRDPDSISDYVLDLADRLGGATATGVAVVSATGVTLYGQEINTVPLDIEDYGEMPVGTACTFWLSGGVVGVDGAITLRITAGARSFDVSFKVQMVGS